MRFEEFAAARLNAMLRYAMLLAGDREEARDPVQDVLARALVRWERICRIEEPWAYVRRMLTNEFISRRRRRTVRTVPWGDGYDPPAPPPAEPGAGDEMWRLLGGLPRQQRAVLVLRYYEGLSDAEIAETLSCPGGHSPGVRVPSPGRPADRAGRRGRSALMNRLDDLRQSLEEHARLAPGASGVIDAARAGAVRIHRRRRIVLVTTAAVAVALLATAVPVTLRRQAGPPARPHPAAGRQAFELTVGLDPAYPATSVTRSVGASRQELSVERGSFAATVTASDPGTQNPTGGVNTTGPVETVTVGGHPATYNGTQRSATVAWTLPGGVTVQVRSGPAAAGEAALLALVGAVRIGPPVALAMPFRPGPIPAGSSFTGTTYDGPARTSTPRVAAIRFDATVDGTPGVPIQIAAFDRHDLTGTRMPDVAGHPAAWQGMLMPHSFEGTITLQAGRCWYQFSVTNAVITRDQLVRLAERTEFTDCTDPSTWVPLSG